MKILYEPVTVSEEYRAIMSLIFLKSGRLLCVMIHKSGNLPFAKYRNEKFQNHEVLIVH